MNEDYADDLRWKWLFSLRGNDRFVRTVEKFSKFAWRVIFAGAVFEMFRNADTIISVLLGIPS